jgi:molybdopterin-guanine dinucleotide biosynthesis protein A
MAAGGIVLCGGGSRRMGRPKAWLEFGPERMLQRVVRLLGEAVRPVIVVAARDQQLPELPPVLPVLHDRQPDRGPLEGIAVGLARLEDEADLAFVTACDAPLLRPAFVRRLVELVEDYDIAVPHVGGYDHPLTSVYRTSVLPHAESLLSAGRVRPAFLFDQVRTRRVTAEELMNVDPQLESVMNVNSPADYVAAMERAGLEKEAR